MEPRVVPCAGFAQAGELGSRHIGVVHTEFLLYARLVADHQYKRTLNFSAYIRKRRGRLGLTQEDVAHAADMAVRHFQNLEDADVNVTLRTMTKVARALKSDLRDLL